MLFSLFFTFQIPFCTGKPFTIIIPNFYDFFASEPLQNLNIFIESYSTCVIVFCLLSITCPYLREEAIAFVCALTN